MLNKKHCFYTFCLLVILLNTGEINVIHANDDVQNIVSQHVSTNFQLEPNAPIVTESELLSVISIMKARNTNINAIIVMQRHNISLKRLQQIIADISLIMPYVRANRELKKVPDNFTDRFSYKSYIELTKKYALTYIVNRYSQETFKSACDIFNKYADVIDTVIFDTNNRL